MLQELNGGTPPLRNLIHQRDEFTPPSGTRFMLLQSLRESQSARRITGIQINPYKRSNFIHLMGIMLKEFPGIGLGVSRTAGGHQSARIQLAKFWSIFQVGDSAVQHSKAFRKGIAREQAAGVKKNGLKIGWVLVVGLFIPFET